MARHGDASDPVFLSPSAYVAFGFIQFATPLILYRMALDVLALAHELCKGTIERVLGMSNAELGFDLLLGNQSAPKR
jgi:hypothetical protein